MHDRKRQPKATGRISIALLAGLMLLTATPSMAQTRNWVWSLYPDGNPVVLAQEIPDTPDLKTTLECEPKGNRVRITLYGPHRLNSGPASITSGNRSTMGEITVHPDSIQAGLPADHPAFVSFTASGALKLVQNGQAIDLTVEQPYLNILRHFARLCVA